MSFAILSTLSLREIWSWFNCRVFARHLVQTVLVIALFAVAICTEDLALGNLLHDAFPPVPACHEMRNRDDFVIRVKVVEVETPSVVLATVTALTAR